MRSQRGFALVAALWLLVALSAAALHLSLRARDRRLAAANVAEETQARAAALSGLAHARALLTRRLEEREGLAGGSASPLSLDPWRDVERLFPDSLALPHASYRVVLRDAGAALNLNLATEEELLRLLLALGVDGGRADQIAQSVMDWRDPDDLHRGRGAERDFYERVSAPAVPRNGPFADLSELAYVRGVTPEIHRRLRPHLTLLGSGQVNLNAADPVVLLSLPGMSDGAVGVLMRYRSQGRALGTLFELSQELSPKARYLFLAELPRLMLRTTTETREIEARSEGWVVGSRVRVRAEGLLVRAGGTAYLVGRRIR
ncbi:MAG TPA: hypothetical protein VHG28_04630 [Longimicrobiaceae bacterium]|nr:hypothetical protein [Longimicrobiaceae bacterium]